jgi:hypothetical protein
MLTAPSIQSWTKARWTHSCAGSMQETAACKCWRSVTGEAAVRAGHKVDHPSQQPHAHLHQASKQMLCQQSWMRSGSYRDEVPISALAGDSRQCLG